MLSYIQPRNRKEKYEDVCKNDMDNHDECFLSLRQVQAATGAYEDIMRMVLFFLLVAVAERNMGAVFAAGIVFTAAWGALSLFEAETKKKRHANKVRQCRVRKDINRTIQIEQ